MCDYYRPYYRDLLVEDEDETWGYEDQILVAEFCMFKADYIVSCIVCKECRDNTDYRVNERSLPMAG